MSGSVNKCIIVGKLGRDPEIRFAQNGNRIANLAVATSERWTDKMSGEKRERTEWHRVVIFDQNIAEVAEKYLKKGAKVYLEGQLATRKWTDQQGADRYTTEVVLQQFRGQLTMLSSANGGPDAYGSSSAAYSGGGATGGAAGGSPARAGANPGDPLDLDDDIPF